MLTFLSSQSNKLTLSFLFSAYWKYSIMPSNAKQQCKVTNICTHLQRGIPKLWERSGSHCSEVHKHTFSKFPSSLKEVKLISSYDRKTLSALEPWYAKITHLSPTALCKEPARAWVSLVRPARCSDVYTASITVVLQAGIKIESVWSYLC